jgi:hypothetical protein
MLQQEAKSEIALQAEMDAAMKDLIQKRVESFNPFRKSRLVEWKANIAYLCGHQNIHVQGGEIHELPKSHQTRVVANKILPAVVNDIAVASKVPSAFDVVPAGTDEDDKAAAKLGDKILQYNQRINRFNEQRKGLVLWYDIAGMACRKIWWNPFYRVVGYNPQDPEDPNFNPELQPGQPIFQGEVETAVVPMTELIFDWRAKTTDFEWIIHHKTVTKGWARALYGDKVDRINRKELYDRPSRNSFDAEVLGELDKIAAEITGLLVEPNKGQMIDDDKLVNWYEFWHKPTRTMPRGAYAVLLGDVLIVNMPYPDAIYPHRELPFVFYDPLALDGISVGSVSRISQARPLQREYNMCRSLILDNVDAMGNGVLFVSRAANIAVEKLDNVPGNIVFHDGPYKPIREAGNQIPGSFFAYLGEVEKSINEIFAFHEPSRGMMPRGGPKSAIGLQVLQEADLQQLSPIVRAFNASDERAAYQIVSLALANYGERLIQIVGRDNEWVLERVNTHEITGKVNVIVRQTSSMPLSKALERQEKFALWQSGLLGMPGDPAIRRKVLKSMDLGGMEDILRDNAKDVNFAQREFIVAEKAAQQAVDATQVYVPAINSFDDDLTHIAEHSDWLKGNYWQYMGTGDERFVVMLQAMNDHINQHYQALLLKQAAVATQLFTQADEDKPQSKPASKKSSS